MASLLILAGAMVHDRIKEKKEQKRRKVKDDERIFRQLQAESERREKKAPVERNYDSEDETDEALPRYEDAVRGEPGPSGSGASGDQANGQRPPKYGSAEENANASGSGSGTGRLVEPRRHPGVEFSPDIL